ncbi:MAG TPA: MMPL family transporter [Candidatus Polarisedimenticolia bacterium]|nr:MMPL family transporter [Candidatus Polarisedimenticolia bacterium]
MNRRDAPFLQETFRRIIRHRWWILSLYALLFPVAVVLAMRVPTDNSIDRLIVRDDPDYLAQEAFRKLFPEGEHVVLLAEAADPFAPGVVQKVEEIEARLAGLPGVRTFSAPALFRRADAVAGARQDFRRFATGTELLRKQGLVGDDFLGIAVEIGGGSAGERSKNLAAIDRALAPIESAPAPLRALRKIGGPYVDAYLEAETRSSSTRYFPLFGLFIVGINLALYRSVRTLAAFLITLAASVAFTMAFARLAGYASTIVSSLVPLTVLITCTAALVYIQSRYAENPEGNDPETHQIFTLANKFLATSASIFAAAIGFAALAVSKIRPIREMGLWVAAGLLLTWVAVFTLFPALQRILRTPILPRRTAAGKLLLRLLEALPRFSYRWRWALLAGSLILMGAGAVALTGAGRTIAPMRLQTDALDYIDPDLPLSRDTRRFEKAIGGLSVVQIWVSSPAGRILDAGVLRGLEELSVKLESDARIGSVTGPTTMLRWMRYLAGGADRLDGDDAAWEGHAATMEGLMLQEPELRSFVDVAGLSDARLTLIYRAEEFQGVEPLKRLVRTMWDSVAATDPALSGCRMRLVGEGMLQAKIAQHMVPTLTESFFLTAVIIFLAFLLVFRSGAARIMAMIPSLFAILVMFLVMRLTGIPLNVATILIASTVLGASENDQIHFFYHFQERRSSGTTEQALAHALRIAGRAIVFATFINAGGFLALALSRLPPMRQFGIVTSSAFVLSMLASFTALPAALWIFSRESPAGKAGR